MANNNSSQWMPTAGGVLNIVVGVLGIIGSLTCGVFAVLLNTAQVTLTSHINDPEAIPFLIAVLWICFAFFLVTSIISIIGGVFAIRRKCWGWALAGSICSVLCSNIIGVIALIFIIMGKKEFDGQGNNASNLAAGR
jgi:hypothetical protein